MPLDGTYPVSRKVEIYTKALVLLKEKGWCKNALRDTQGRHCLLGAIIDCEGAFLSLSRDVTVNTSNEKNDPSWELDIPRNEWIQLVKFNNASCTTFEDVTQWFENQIEKETALALVN